LAAQVGHVFQHIDADDGIEALRRLRQRLAHADIAGDWQAAAAGMTSRGLDRR